MKIFEASFPVTIQRDNIQFHACRFTHGTEPVKSLQTADLGTLSLPESLNNAIPKRQAEFLAGRYCAGKACKNITGAFETFPIGAAREPLWPKGLQGSISHTAGYAIAAVCKNRTIGLDVEELVPLADYETIRKYVCTEAEISLLLEILPPQQALTAIFSAKEAIYKAIYPLVQQFVDFHEMTCVAATASSLTFQPSEKLCQLPARLEVHYHSWDELYFTLCCY
ncbi:4'-phosphopantetheinyl transferase family protein [Kiloniella laminariae]|uniref:4'-phosphopantetheinyl transferase family protein n=1 Tax=Kiloniella laminariae TaxID=454162 RepID=UPI0003765838|nr:4'-phosphopantetheinyl transferase superfamily protein [Kiloniella laminariae]